ncbi:CYTH domain-containing protein [Laribacter hongkongensis]|uniref:CYTH domain-containing protein n=1 Tax=Laribacter hongkongensis TaxID=168471 RepID=UPI001EFCFC09|nr:CYTH domain-containing protein [Laribacter hongkongensis]MCG9094328.1 CYTH domain-containing protein [Laribacter hongkongensis]
MAQEIERKFLVRGDFRPFVSRQERIVQGYLNSAPERCVRIRIKGGRGFITVKGIGNASGVSRFEWEREIPLAEAESLLALCEPGVIDKVRHEVHLGRHVFEVDEFAGSNAGLVLAEIELSSEDEDFARPGWLGAEVTGDLRYYNVMLMKEPYGSWPEQVRSG